MALRGGYVRDLLKRNPFLPLLYTSTLDLENDVPTPTSRQEVNAKKFHTRGAARGADRCSFPIYFE